MYYKSDAVVEGERYGLHLIKENPHVINWLPTAYHVASVEFENPENAVFGYNSHLGVVTKHTLFSKFISDLVFYSEYKNLPVRSIQNGLGSIDIAAMLLALYAVIIYWRVY
ncbi:MAG: hypothetical protein E6K54_07975 [Gammaproteobacteria bacterium]|nr:MAG: hypothetical protein E6K54_07975 [Gammaproteobacteria bacterium]